MTITIAVNQSNDIYRGTDGNLTFVSGLEAVLQLCEHAMKTRLGEVELDSDEGIPYFDVVFVGAPNLIQFEAASRKTLLAVDGVVEIIDFKMSLVDNTLTYLADIKTVYGQGSIGG